MSYLGGKPWKSTGLSEIVAAIDALFDVTKISPTQSAHMINDYGLPSVIAKLQAALDIIWTTLQEAECYWRKRIKRLLFLPHYLNDGVIFLPMARGRFGFTSIELAVLEARRLALREMTNRSAITRELAIESPTYKKLMEAYKRFDLEGSDLPTFKMQFFNKWREQWTSSQTQSTGANCFLQGNFARDTISFRYRQTYHRNYLDHVKLRFCLLESRNVLGRMNKEAATNCRHCNGKTESNMHVLNACEYSTPAMIKRHNEVDKRFIWSLENKNEGKFLTSIEPCLIDDAGNRVRPDLIVLEPNSGFCGIL
ncbi:hypothetical protein ACOME3_000009 [Neoechinorhynchus agilis]